MENALTHGRYRLSGLRECRYEDQLSVKVARLKQFAEIDRNTVYGGLRYMRVCKAIQQCVPFVVLSSIRWLTRGCVLLRFKRFISASVTENSRQASSKELGKQDGF